MVQEPALRDVFLVKDGGQWRAPKVNETCCRRPALADLLQKGARATGLVHIGMARLLTVLNSTHVCWQPATVACGRPHQALRKVCPSAILRPPWCSMLMSMRSCERPHVVHQVAGAKHCVVPDVGAGSIAAHVGPMPSWMTY